jgi:hypothetical protein
VSYYRFLENPKVEQSVLVKSLQAQCAQQLRGRHVLAINDTSEVNLQAHAGRLKPAGQGVVGNNKDIGFFIHPTVVVDASSGLPLGFSNLQLWTREKDRPSKRQRNYKQLPIEDKESYKWITAALGSAECLAQGDVAQVTYIGDRESDIYESWSKTPSDTVHLLVRAGKNRRLADSPHKLYERLSSQPIVGIEDVEIPADARLNRTARTAQMAIRMVPVQIKRTQRLSDEYPESVTLYAIEAIEQNPPTQEAAVHWRLLTTHPVETFEQAKTIVQWYRWRWHIELLFALLKQRGLQIESSQLESVAAIEKLCIIALSVALQVLQLTLGRERQDLSADIVLNQARQDCLSQIAPQLEGRTAKLKNPYLGGSLAWLAWLIARLGGWSGYQSQRPPGYETLYRGLQQFEMMFTGWSIARSA